jgi:hypothetical protein
VALVWGVGCTDRYQILEHVPGNFTDANVCLALF